MRSEALGISVVFLLAAGLGTAQTTRGDIQGRAIDEVGTALPGVTVTLASKSLLGGKSAVTANNGAFKFLVLPPGIYAATFSLVGFQTQQQPNIKVGIDATVRLEVTMIEAFSDEIIVSAESPLVNTSDTTIGIELSQDFYLDLPMDRNYTAVAAVTPGAQDDLSGQTFYGSTGAENAYYIDGVNTTDIERGQQGTVLNFEFVDEVQVKAGSYGAEYGHATGGLINVITKSGGNEFHGDVFGYLDSDALRAPLTGEAEQGSVSDTSKTVGVVRFDYGADLGGYIVKDRLWFFGAYDRVDNRDTNEALEDYGAEVPGAPMAGDQLPWDTTRDLFALKLSASGRQPLVVGVGFRRSDNRGRGVAYGGMVGGGWFCGGTDLLPEEATHRRHGRRDQLRRRLRPERGAQRPLRQPQPEGRVGRTRQGAHRVLRFHRSIRHRNSAGRLGGRGVGVGQFQRGGSRPQAVQRRSLVVRG